MGLHTLFKKTFRRLFPRDMLLSRHILNDLPLRSIFLDLDQKFECHKLRLPFYTTPNAA